MSAVPYTKKVTVLYYVTKYSTNTFFVIKYTTEQLNLDVADLSVV